MRLFSAHGAHLLYKRFGHREKVVQRLEKIITVVAAYSFDSLRSLRAGPQSLRGLRIRSVAF